MQTDPSPIRPGGVVLQIYGPPGAAYFLLAEVGQSIDFSSIAPGFLGSVGLSSAYSNIPGITVPPSFFTVPAGQVQGVLPASGVQTLTSTGSLTTGFSTAIKFQAAVVDTVGSFVRPVPVGGPPNNYLTNSVVRVPRAPFGAGPATYTAGPSVPGIAGFLRDVEQGDIDGDGDEDRVIIDQAGVASIYTLTAGTGTLVRTQILPIPVGSTSAELADIDDDGWLDLVVASNSAPNTPFLSVYRNSATAPNWAGFVVAPAAQVAQPFAVNANDVETGDLFGGGAIDIVVACGSAPCTGQQNRLILNGSVGGQAISLFDLTSTLMPVLSDDSEDIEVADIDGDGDSDLIVGNFDGPPAIEGQNYILVNSGGAVFNFVPPVRFGAPAETLDVLVTDVNVDGLPDIYVANWLANASCGGPYVRTQTDQLHINLNSHFAFLDASFLLPDNPAYTGATPTAAWAGIDAEAVGGPGIALTNSPAALPPIGSGFEFKDYDNDGDPDIFVALGSFGIANPLVSVPIAGQNRGIMILVNNLNTPGAFLPPPFTTDRQLTALGARGSVGLPDYNDIELGDWWIPGTTVQEHFAKDIGTATINQGHFGIHKD